MMSDGAGLQSEMISGNMSVQSMAAICLAPLPEQRELGSSIFVVGRGTEFMLAVHQLPGILASIKSRYHII